MENLVASYKNKRVLITGHSGFKGSWLCLWLSRLGADITGVSIDIPTVPSNYVLADIDSLVNSIWADINDLAAMKKIIQQVNPEIVFHLAAQPLVIDSYKDPLNTFATNIIGTANILEAVRGSSSVKAVVAITTDKVYENIESHYAYKETDKLGGYDPYSASKAAAEIIISSYRNSFFNLADYCNSHNVLLSSTRAGNVIGGGDFAENRLIPDCIKSFINNERVKLRNPAFVRPWQHVLEPLYGYMLLGEKLLQGQKDYARAWNFGPDIADAVDVKSVVKMLVDKWGDGAEFDIQPGQKLHEAQLLMLDSTRAREMLNWSPVWHVPDAIEKIVQWSKVYRNSGNIREICLRQIDEYSEVVRKNG